MSIRHVAKGPVLSVTATLRELGLTKARAEALAGEVEALVDRVVPRAPKARPAKHRSKPRTSVRQAA